METGAKITLSKSLLVRKNSGPKIVQYEGIAFFFKEKWIEIIILKMREREWWNGKQKGKNLENISYIDLEGKNIKKDKYVEKLWGWYK